MVVLNNKTKTHGSSKQAEGVCVEAVSSIMNEELEGGFLTLRSNAKAAELCQCRYRHRGLKRRPLARKGPLQLENRDEEHSARKFSKRMVLAKARKDMFRGKVKNISRLLHSKVA